MKTLFTFFLFIMITAEASGQQFVIDSTRFIGGDSLCNLTEANCAIPTGSSGILFVGETACVGGGDIPVTTLSGQNVFVGKMDNNMQLSWLKVYGGNGDEGAVSVCQAAHGGYAILAYTTSNDGEVSGNHSLGGGAEDLWLMRIDSVGNLLWSKCFGGPGDEIPTSVTATPDGGFILMGASNMAGGDVPFLYTTTDYDWFVVKTDSEGNKQWANVFCGTGTITYGGGILLADTGYYLAGSSSSSSHDCTDTAWHAGVGTGEDFYLLKIDIAGNRVWDRSYGGSQQEVCHSAIWDSRDSTIVMTGSTYSNDYMVSGLHGQEDAWVMKADRNGNFIRSTCLGGSGADIVWGISTAEAPGMGYVTAASINSGPIGWEDGWLFATDSAGNMEYNKIFGGTRSDYDGTNTGFSASLIPFKNGYAAVGGSTSQFFTEGYNFGRIGYVEDAFISYIHTGPLGIDNINAGAGKLKLYPNPAQERVRIVFPNRSEGKITISNNKGQSVYKQTLRQVQDHIDINTKDWAKGAYIVQWKSDDDYKATQKLIVE